MQPEYQAGLNGSVRQRPRVRIGQRAARRSALTIDGGTARPSAMRGATSAGRHDPRRPRLLPVQGRATGRVIYVGKANSLRQRLSNYFQNPRNLPPRTAQMVATAETVEWIQVRNEVEALMLEYSLIKQHQPRFNVRLRDDKSYPFLAVTLDDEWPRPMVMRGRKRKGVRYFGPYGHAYAIRETLDLLLRTFPIRTCSRQQVRPPPAPRAGPACCSTSRSARARASARSTTRTTTRWSQELLDFLDGDTDPIVPPPRAADARRGRRASSSSGPPGCATGWRSVRKAIEKQQMVADRNEDLDVIGIAEDDLEAAVQVFFVRQGRVVGPQGLRPRQGRGPHRRRAGRRRPRGPLLRRPAARRAQAGARARRPDDPELYEEWLRAACAARGRHPGAAAGRQAGAAGDGHPQRRGGVHPPPAAPGQRPQQPGPGPQRAAGRARPARGPAAHRVLRHEPHPGHRLRRVDGGDGGRPAQEVRLPALQGQDGAGQRRLRGHGGGAHPAAHRLPRRAGAAGRASGRASSPTRPSCCWSTAARASSPWPCGCSRSSASTTRSRWRRWPSSSRRSTSPARPTRSASRAESEALYLLQRIRDEAHRFAITLPPPAARQAHDQVGARRHPGPRADPQEAADQGARRRDRR